MTTPFPPAIADVTPAARAQRARALLYSADLAGIGNVRRTLSIAHEVAWLRPDAALLCLTGGLQTHAYDLPANFDYVKLPTAASHALYGHIPPGPDHPRGYGGLAALRERLAFETATSFAPHVFLVDNLPAGVSWELTRALYHLRATDPRVSLILGLRDVVDEPDRVLAEWQRAGHIDLIEQVFDCILVYGCPEVIDPEREYGFPASVTDKMTVCGYVRRPEPLTPAETIRAQLDAGDQPLIVVSVGGGRLGAHLLRLYFTALRERRAGLDGVVSYVVVGPLLAADEAELAGIMALADGLPNLTIVRFVDDLFSYLNAADVVVTVGGQTLVEAVSLGKRAVALPQTAARDQYVRAQRLARLGLCDWVPESEQSAERLAVAVRGALAKPPPAPRLDFGGRERAGAILADLLPR